MKPFRIPLSNIDIGAFEIKNVNQALNDGWISGSGEFVNEFEKLLTLITGADYAIATSNGTTALEVVLQAIGVGRGEEVIVPALTFAAPAAAVIRSQGNPVFVDVDEESWTINPEALQYAQTQTPIIAVDLLGHPANYNKLERFERVIEDAAEAHGASMFVGEEIKQAGNLAKFATFSFHANKAITTGEGGAMLFGENLGGYSRRARAIVNHGIFTGKPAYFHELAGTNARMTNITAAIGCGQVVRWHELISRRKDVENMYLKYLPKHVTNRPTASWVHERSTWLMCVLHPESQEALNKLSNAGIDARRIFRPLPSLPPYLENNWRSKYPIATKISEQAIFLPTWVGLKEEQIEEICSLL